MKRDEVARERLRNPFHELFVTELLEDPKQYRRMFSPLVLVGESLQVFRAANTVVLGPQGSGKSMLLNLLRYRVVGEWLKSDGRLPDPIRTADPYVGVSVNLVRAHFAAFGSRTISQSRNEPPNPSLDAAAAFDYLSHVLLREFLRAVQFAESSEGRLFARWAGLTGSTPIGPSFAKAIAKWPTWSGWYRRESSLDGLIGRCEKRLDVWRRFTNANINSVPPDVWKTKTNPGEAMHALGNLLRDRTTLRTGLPLFVSIDQYEVMPELNAVFGTMLQRLLNSVIKARDPVVFYKIGARTYDWGRELRVWPSDSRIEEQRDYRILDLATLLMRHESGKWLFPKVATDVVKRRISLLQDDTPMPHREPVSIFGLWEAHAESWMYFKRGQRKEKKRPLSGPELRKLMGSLDEEALEAILRSCKEPRSPLDVRLACAWAAQQEKRRLGGRKLLRSARSQPWEHVWWKKERIGVALVQIASQARQRKLYYGWTNIQYLAGGNITALIYMLGEIWDDALKNGTDPFNQVIPASQQSEGIRKAGERWLARDRNEVRGGSRRFEVIQRLGEQIHEYLIADNAISNPGHSGFSISEAGLADPEYTRERDFLLTAVHWAILEERTHTSKEHDGDRRRKFFLHPLLSSVFNIPITRVKEPLYTKMSIVSGMIHGTERIFVHNKAIARRAKTAKGRH